MSLAARYLEEAGIATVILGSALDIVEHCGVPRFVFTDFPLGNPCGRPFDANMQRAIVTCGLERLESANRPGTVSRTPFEWGSDTWRAQFMEIRPEDAEALKKQGDARRQMRVGMKTA
ncbi:MAG: hypothetical protein OXF31_11760 [Gammaproteobacteria bacterium]|nr:hypothetical protein [Gammaproteobacteria bacterium]